MRGWFARQARRLHRQGQWRQRGQTRQKRRDGHAERLRAHGQRLLAAGELQKARARFIELVDAHPNMPAGHTGLATVLQREGRHVEALSSWTGIAERFPNTLQAHQQRARIYVELNLLDEAEAIYQATATRWPAETGPAHGLVNVANLKRDSLLLHDRLEALLQRFPGDTAARAFKAWLLAGLGEIEAARTLIEPLLEETETSISVQEARRLLQTIQHFYANRERRQRLRALDRRVSHTLRRRDAPALKVLSAEIRLALDDIGCVTEIVDRLHARGVCLPELESLTRVLDKRYASKYPDFAAPKVFCIGLSRTGTTSLTEALSLLGLHAIHWINPHTRNLISTQDYLLFDAFSDVPVCCRFESLYYTFPNARFIYTNRSCESWVRSVATHYRWRHGVDSPSDLNSENLRRRNQNLAGWIEMNLYSNHDTWEAAYLAFDQRVRHFFADQREEKLLELRICDGEGWDKLCLFLGHQVPARRFPKKNRSTSTVTNAAEG